METEVVVCLKLWNSSELWFQEIGPVVYWDYALAILSADQLNTVHICGRVHNICDVLQTADKGLAEPLLQQAKTLVRRKLCVACQHERNLN